MRQQRGQHSVEVVQSKEGKQLLTVALGRRQRGGLWVRFMLAVIEYGVCFGLQLPPRNGSLTQELLLLPKSVKLLLAADSGVIIMVRNGRSSKSSSSNCMLSTPTFYSNAALIGRFSESGVSGTLTRLRGTAVAVVGALADEAAATATVLLLGAADENNVSSTAG